MDRRRHRVRESRRADGAVLHVLLHVRLPTGRRLDLVGGGLGAEAGDELTVSVGGRPRTIEIAALFAGRPLALSAANDWTVDVERKGLPHLKRVWELYDAEDLVTARCWPELPTRAAAANMHAICEAGRMKGCMVPWPGGRDRLR